VSHSIPPHRPAQLAPSDLRQLASTLIVGAVPTLPPRVASIVVDTVDAAVWAAFGSLGLSPREVQTIGDVLWGQR
jgi:hypothetical protein